MTNKQIAWLGSSVLAMATFLPFTSVPILGFLTYVQGDGVLVLLLAGLSALFATLGKFRLLWGTGAVAAALVGYSVFSVLQLSEGSRLVSLQIGVFALCSGIAIILYAAWKEAPIRFKEPVALALFDKGYRVASTMFYLGVLLASLAPIMLTSLHSTITNPTVVQWLMIWLVSSTLGGVGYLLLLLISGLAFRRGFLFLSALIVSGSALWYPALVSGYWGRSNEVLYYDLSPVMGQTHILPIMGAVLALAGALTAARRQRQNRLGTTAD